MSKCFATKTSQMWYAYVIRIGDIYKTLCKYIIYRTVSVAGQIIIQYNQIQIATMSVRQTFIAVSLLCWDMAPGRFVWYVLSSSLQKCNALASDILSGRSFLEWHFVPWHYVRDSAAWQWSSFSKPSTSTIRWCHIVRQQVTDQVPSIVHSRLTITYIRRRPSLTAQHTSSLEVATIDQITRETRHKLRRSQVAGASRPCRVQLSDFWYLSNTAAGIILLKINSPRKTPRNVKKWLWK